MKLADLDLKARGQRADVRKLRKLIGKGKTTSERGRTEMIFPLDNWDRVFNTLKDEFGEPKKQKHGDEILSYKFGQYRLAKQRRAGEPAAILQFAYM